MSNRYTKIKRSRLAKNDNNNCSVIATSIACRVSYFKAHAACANFGRKDGHGMNNMNILLAAKQLGVELTPVTNRNGKPLLQKNGSKFTPKTIGKRLKSGYFLAFVHAHVFAVVNGEVEDWTDGRAHHIYEVWRVSVPKGSRS
ncbi:MAG: hypothetical protein KAS93_06695 [Gammaproteobacteria bacterium]|nr:hypothetical protein [Gammaproteobacteria bacterium]